MLEGHDGEHRYSPPNTPEGWALPEPEDDDPCIHEKSLGPCEHPTEQPSCPWCIVRRQGRELERLRSLPVDDQRPEPTRHDEPRPGGGSRYTYPAEPAEPVLMPTFEEVPSARRAYEAYQGELERLRKVAEAARAVVRGRIPAVSAELRGSDWKHSRVSDSLTDRLAEALAALESRGTTEEDS